jgi:hypothetical protein
MIDCEALRVPIRHPSLSSWLDQSPSLRRASQKGGSETHGKLDDGIRMPAQLTLQSFELPHWYCEQCDDRRCCRRTSK